MMKLGTKTAVGIHVADHVIEAVELGGDPKPSIRARNRIELDKGIVVNGVIRDKEKLADSMKRLLDEAKPSAIAKRHVVFGIPERATYFHVFDSQKLSAEHIAAEVTRNIPLPAEDIVWGHRVFRQTADVSRIVVVAASRDLISSWQAFFSEQGIVVDRFDIEVFAIFRNLFREFPKEPVLIADIGDRTTTISIFDSAGLVYTRSVYIAGEYFTKEIATVLGLTFAEASEKKVTIGLADREHPIFFPLVKGLEMIVREMRAATEHFARARGLRIAEIVLTGGSSRMPGLAAYMEANFDVPVVEAPPTADIEAVGFALRGLEDRWDASDPTVSLERQNASWHMPKPTLHWSMPQGSGTTNKRTWMLFAAFCIALIFLLVLIYFRYIAG